MFSLSASETFRFAPISRYLLTLRFLLPSRILQLFQPMVLTVNVSSINIDRPRTNFFYFNCIFTGMLLGMGSLHLKSSTRSVLPEKEEKNVYQVSSLKNYARRLKT